MGRFSHRVDWDEVYRRRGWVDEHGELTPAGEREAEERYMERKYGNRDDDDDRDCGDHGYDPGDNFNW